MNITVLGTGMVGRALAARLARLGHNVAIGTRDPQQTLASNEPGAFAAWHADHPDIELLAFADASARAELIINAVLGEASLHALAAAGDENLAGKVLLDLSLPLDFSNGMPPTLAIANTDSLGELVQRAHPESRVVKSLNTVFVDVMIDPARVPGDHTMFVAGDDPAAKAIVRDLLEQFGWPDNRVIDLGGIESARATEMYMQLYFTLVDVLGGFDFNIAVTRA